MKKIIIPFMLALTSSMANAEYLIKIPLEQAQGGQLPNNSIVFVSSTEVVPETPVKHEPVDCLTNPTDNPQLCEKSLTAWEQFADAQNPQLPKTWNDLNWEKKGLSYLPNEPYPITSVSDLNLGNNQLTNVDALSNLTSVGYLGFTMNKIKNVDGLINLTHVNYLSLDYNQLENVDGLSNLKSANNLYLTENPLKNIDGLANVKVTSMIVVDATYSGKKLKADTIFCTYNPDEVFWDAQRSDLCESP